MSTKTQTIDAFVKAKPRATQEHAKDPLALATWLSWFMTNLLYWILVVATLAYTACALAIGVPVLGATLGHTATTIIVGGLAVVVGIITLWRGHQVLCLSHAIEHQIARSYFYRYMAVCVGSAVVFPLIAYFTRAVPGFGVILLLMSMFWVLGIAQISWVPVVEEGENAVFKAIRDNTPLPISFPSSNRDVVEGSDRHFATSDEEVLVAFYKRRRTRGE